MFITINKRVSISKETVHFGIKKPKQADHDGVFLFHFRILVVWKNSD